MFRQGEVKSILKRLPTFLCKTMPNLLLVRQNIHINIFELQNLLRYITRTHNVIEEEIFF